MPRTKKSVEPIAVEQPEVEEKKRSYIPRITPEMVTNPSEIEIAEGKIVGSLDYVFRKVHKAAFGQLAITSKAKFDAVATLYWQWHEAEEDRKAEARVEEIVQEAFANPLLLEKLIKQMQSALPTEARETAKAGKGGKNELGNS